MRTQLVRIEAWWAALAGYRTRLSVIPNSDQSIKQVSVASTSELIDDAEALIAFSKLRTAWNLSGHLTKFVNAAKRVRATTVFEILHQPIAFVLILFGGALFFEL